MARGTKVLSLFVVVLLVTSTVSLTVFAQENPDGTDTTTGSEDVPPDLVVQVDAAAGFESTPTAGPRTVGADEDDGVTTVILELTAVTAENVDDLENRGADVTTIYRRYVQAEIPTAAYDSFAELPYVASITVARQAEVAAHPPNQPVGEGVELLGADDVHALGFTGDGVVVGVLDTGFTVDHPTIAQSVVESRSFRADGDITGGGGLNEQHGTAVAEIVHEMAPDADLYLANAGTEVEFANAVEWLLANDVDVITVSMGWRLTSQDGNAISDQALASATDAGVAVTAAAGNDAEAHWIGPNTDGDGDGFIEFSPGNEANFVNNGNLISQGQPITVIALWNEWPATDRDFDLFLVQFQNGQQTVVAASTAVQDGSDEPWEGVNIPAPATAQYFVAIRDNGRQGANSVQANDALGPDEVELFSYGRPLSVPDPRSSIASPATADDVIGVGAFFWQTGDIESFSSHGETNDGRNGIDVVGPDGVTNTALNPFFGTSAATPYTAGTAALVKQADPSLTGAEIQDVLTATAEDVLPPTPTSESADPSVLGPGEDTTSGYGRIDALAAVEYTLANADDAADGTLVRVVLNNSSTGLQQYSLTVQATGGTVESVESVLLDEELFQTVDGGPGESFVTARSADLFDEVGPSTDPRVLFLVRFETPVTASDLAVFGTVVDDSGQIVPTSEVRLEVVPGGALFDAPISGTQATAPPNDLDGDGLYEDVDGDGVLTMADAVSLSFADVSGLTADQAAALDFDGDGLFSFGDAQALADLV